MNLSPEMSLVMARLDRIEAGQSRQISPWLSSAETAEFLRCSVRQIERLTQEGYLPYRRLSPGQRGSRLYHRKHLTAYLVTGKNPTTYRLTSLEKKEVEKLLR